MLRWLPVLQMMMLAGVAFLAGRVVARTLPVLKEWRARRFDLGSPALPIVTAVTCGVALLCLAGTAVGLVWIVLRLVRA